MKQKKKINKSFDNLLNCNFSKTKQTYSDLFIFAKVRHLFKDTNNLSNSGFLIISILFYKPKYDENFKLMFDSEELLNYYDNNFEDNNIRCEFNKQTPKFTFKLKYLKNNNIKLDNENWEWKTFNYVLDNNKYQEDKKQNKKLCENKLDIMNDDEIVKNRISQNIIIKNILNNLVNICEK